MISWIRWELHRNSFHADDLRMHRSLDRFVIKGESEVTIEDDGI